ncbi:MULTISPECIES: ParA family protein [Rhizobiaceae]|jgi:chromosome partitioning protein|uniref:Chromosome partitioning protein n=1 Tax=Aliirhizobium cellulosilyticum TaxID=393664 RepID=A0A7W6UZY9_9HYPH|nr:ParA family protein [Rhizobium cellulosilyticum]MBB4348958.1 chromosome partitioning protein [Rhizobium cellulosilyticum]MBB4412821.1 chromosome partitioning protein [Rhizobium cellulosilyticum]MBB4447453.1 chromosome partitioning protein [Rhizobium cellulosilyticum]
MPVITFANTKGGAGKTTMALVVAGELAKRGFRVAMLDADPQQWVSRWMVRMAKVPKFSIIADIDADNIEKTIKDLKKRNDYVVVDLPGGVTPLLAKGLGLSDHVFVPVQGCALDAAGGAQVLDILKKLKSECDIHIAHSVALTRVSSIITTRALLAVKGMLAQQGVHVLATPLIERAAYRDMFDAGTLIDALDPEAVSNLAKAQDNARLLVDEIAQFAPVPVKVPKTAKSTATAKAKAETPRKTTAARKAA